MKRVLYGLAGVFGVGMTATCLVVLWCVGGVLQLASEKPQTPVVLRADETPAPDKEGQLVEVHGCLQSAEELAVPEFGIRMNACALIVEARVVGEVADSCAELWPLAQVVPGTPGEVTPQNCPTRSLWAATLRLGNYLVNSELLRALYSDHSPAGHRCEQSFQPLPPEHIQLPEALRRIARLLPETVRLDHPPCTIYRLSERYRCAETPTGNAEVGDVELRFSYLPSDIPAAVRGRLHWNTITNGGMHECAFAAGGQKLPQVSVSPLAASAQLFLHTSACFGSSILFLFLLAGVAMVDIWRRRGGTSGSPRLLPLFMVSVALFLLSLLGGYLLF